MAESRSLDFSVRKEERRGLGREYGRAGPGVVRMADTSRGQGRLQGQGQEQCQGRLQGQGQGQEQSQEQRQGRVQGQEQRQGRAQGQEQRQGRAQGHGSKRDRTGLSLSLQGDCGKKQVSRKSSLGSQSSVSACCCSCSTSRMVEQRMSPEDEDEVDAPSRRSSTAQLVDIAFKLAFLKILLVDIGISLGDTVTDFLQGFSLILDLSSPASLHWPTLPYGLALLLASWLPLPITLLHLGFSEEHGVQSYCRSLPSLLLLLLAALLFPFLPTLYYLYLLVSPRGTQAQREEYKRTERRAHEIKSMCGAVEAPVQLVLLLYLMLRGVLTLPWAEPLSSSCVEDSLGRVACLPSLPMASIIFSTLSIIKALFDLNIYPLVREYETCCDTYKVSLHLLFRFAPFFFANAVFRICSFALIIVFLDWWSVIPFSLLLFLNLVVFGLSFRRFSSPPSPTTSCHSLPALELHRLSTMQYSEPRLQHGASVATLPGTPTDEDRRRAVVGWVPPKDLDPRPYKFDPVGWNQHMLVMSPPTPLEDCLPGLQDTIDEGKRYSILSRMSSMVSSEKTVTPFYINEENTSVFLNALTGMFFPTCHTHLQPLGPEMATSDPATYRAKNRERLEGLLAWQGQIYRRQVYCFNSLLMVVLLVVLVLVTGLPSFNYRDNVLSSFWFPLSTCLLLASGLLSLLLTYMLDRPCLPRKPEQEHGQEHEQEQEKEHEQEHRDSVSKRGLCLASVFCLLLCCAVLLPGLLGLVVFHSSQQTSPYLLLVDTAASPVSLSILAAVSVLQPGAELATRSGPLSTDCLLEGPGLRGAILLVNSSRPACRGLMAGGAILVRAEQVGVTAVVLLDDTPKSQWRVSSPFSSPSLSLSSSITSLPLLLIREADWQAADSQLLQLSRSGRPVFLVWNDPSTVSLQPLFSCTAASLVGLEGGPQGGAEQDCREGKVLHGNGSLQEQVCVSGQCSVLGRPCPYPWFRPLHHFPLSLSCSNLTDTDLTLVDRDSSPLPVVSLPLPSSSSPSPYCCSSSSPSSSFLTVLGSSCFSSWPSVSSSLSLCHWSPWVSGSCRMEEREVYRLCLPPGGQDCVVREHRTVNCNTGRQLDKCTGSSKTCS